jgi:hypothetical protein
MKALPLLLGAPKSPSAVHLPACDNACGHAPQPPFIAKGSKRPNASFVSPIGFAQSKRLAGRQVGTLFHHCGCIRQRQGRSSGWLTPGTSKS